MNLPPVLGEDQSGDGDREEGGEWDGGPDRDDAGEEGDSDQRLAVTERGADERREGDADHREACGVGEHARLAA